MRALNERDISVVVCTHEVLCAVVTKAMATACHNRSEKKQKRKRIKQIERPTDERIHVPGEGDRLFIEF